MINAIFCFHIQKGFFGVKRNLHMQLPVFYVAS